MHGRAGRSLRLDICGRRVPHQISVVDHIPPLPLTVDGHGGAVGEPGQDRCRGVRRRTEIQRAVPYGDDPLPHRRGVDERQAEVGRQRPGQLLGDGLRMPLDPQASS